MKLIYKGVLAMALMSSIAVHAQTPKEDKAYEEGFADGRDAQIETIKRHPGTDYVQIRNAPSPDISPEKRQELQAKLKGVNTTDDDQHELPPTPGYQSERQVAGLDVRPQAAPVVTPVPAPVASDNSQMTQLLLQQNRAMTQMQQERMRFDMQLQQQAITNQHQVNMALIQSQQTALQQPQRGTSYSPAPVQQYQQPEVVYDQPVEQVSPPVYTYTPPPPPPVTYYAQPAVTYPPPPPPVTYYAQPVVTYPPQMVVTPPVYSPVASVRYYAAPSYSYTQPYHVGRRGYRW